MSRLSNLYEDKPRLLVVIAFSLVGILSLPIIVPHIFHGAHIFHIILHVVGIIVAVFLTIISAVAYSRARTKRLLFTMIAFSFFIAAESLSLIDATWPFTFYINETSLNEMSHILLITMLLIFTMAVMRKE